MGGICKYEIKTKSIQVYPYPNDLRPYKHSMCKVRDEIIIVDGDKHGSIIAFDMTTQKYKQQCKIDKIGWYPNCIAVGNHVHIMGGMQNKNGTHYVYNVDSNSMGSEVDETSKGGLH